MRGFCPACGRPHVGECEKAKEMKEERSTSVTFKGDPWPDVKKFDLPGPLQEPFHRGDAVRKKKGGKWEGIVCTCYRSWLKREWHVVVECTLPGVEGQEHLYAADLVEIDK